MINEMKVVMCECVCVMQCCMNVVMNNIIILRVAAFLAMFCWFATVQNVRIP